MTLAYVAIGVLFLVCLALLAFIAYLIHRDAKTHAELIRQSNAERAELLDRIQAPEQKQWEVAARAQAESVDLEDIDRQVEEAFAKLPASVVHYDADLVD